MGDEQQTMANVKEELNILKSAVIDIQQDLNKVRTVLLRVRTIYSSESTQLYQRRLSQSLDIRYLN